LYIKLTKTYLLFQESVNIIILTGKADYRYVSFNDLVLPSNGITAKCHMYI
jgi:hypothetical protein